MDALAAIHLSPRDHKSIPVIQLGQRSYVGGQIKPRRLILTAQNDALPIVQLVEWSDSVLHAHGEALDRPHVCRLAPVPETREAQVIPGIRQRRRAKVSLYARAVATISGPSHVHGPFTTQLTGSFFGADC